MSNTGLHITDLLTERSRSYAGLAGAVSARLRLLASDGELIVEAAAGSEQPKVDAALIDILLLSGEEEISLNRDSLGALARSTRFCDGSTLLLVLTYDRKQRKPNGREISGYLRHDARKKFLSLAKRISQALESQPAHCRPHDGSLGVNESDRR